MSGAALIDGVPDDGVLSRDRGLHYGDGVFETMAVRDGRVQHWDKHLARLTRGCAVLGFAAPPAATLRADLAALTLAPQCVAKLIVTRGDGQRGYAPAAEAQARRIWQVSAWPEVDPGLYAEGARAVWLHTTLARQPALAGIKHLNRLEQVLAARELAAAEAAPHEGLLSDALGNVIEAVSANVFMARDNVLSTPALEHAGIAGVMREVVIEMARELGIEVVVGSLRRADFAFAEEVFLTNSVRGLVPVARLGDIAYQRGLVFDALCKGLARSTHGVGP